MADTPRTAPISEDVERIMAEDEAKKKAAAAEAAKPNPTGTRDVTDTEIGKLLGDSTLAAKNVRSAQEMIDAMKKAEQRSFGQLEKIEPPKKK
jgi:hypothetical protein